MKTRSIILLTLASFILCGCLGEIIESPSLAKQEVLMEFYADYPAITKAKDNCFDDGDQMGIFVSRNDNSKPLGCNVRFTYDAGLSQWNGSSSIYWPGDGASVDVMGYYPYDDNLKDENKYEFSIKAKQDSYENYESSDLLWTKKEKVSQTEGLITLTYHHIMAGITVKLEQGSGFEDGEWDGLTKKVYILNAAEKCDVDLSEGTISNANGSTSITSAEWSNQFKAVTIPKVYVSGTSILGIAIDGYEYHFSKTEDVSLESGKMYTFTIRIDKKTSGDYSFAVTNDDITSWLDDEDFHDGIIRQYVNVYVSEPGTFAQTLADNGLDYSKIVALKVSGRVNDDDIYFMGDMPGLANLNMKDMIIDNPGDESDYIIPDNAFQASNIQRLVLPDNLLLIGNYSFEDCSISGTLVFPNGLLEIAECAFMHRNKGNNSMKVVFPSTLKRIGNEAFRGFGGSPVLKGELVLNEGLEYIGDTAFENTSSNVSLEGILLLPSSLKYIGRSAFRRSGKFDKDLIIPQNISKIEEYTFGGCKFAGNLILPEGLEEIGSNAFNGTSLNGELVLPSTLKRINEKAFADNAFSRVILPENLSILESSAFENCTNLEGEIIIPENVTSISASTFANCPKISRIVLHENVRLINSKAFAGDVGIREIICDSPQPPILADDAFDNVVKSRISLQVPKSGLYDYKNDLSWREFTRISEYRNFVCRPSSSCALSEGEQTLVLNADAAWTLVHKPEWVEVSPTCGELKTAVNLKFETCSAGESRRDSLVFRLDGTEIETYCALTQCGYQYVEDEVVTLQSHSKGNGIQIYMIGDGWNAESIANGNYLNLCNQYMEYFFGLPPYDRLRDYFDVHALIALSQEEGVNTVGTARETKFGTFASQNTLMPEEDRVYDYITQTTGHRLGQWYRDGDIWKDVIVLIPNTTDYSGGTYFNTDQWGNIEGSSISICPPSAKSYPNDTRGSVQHEVGGHGFGKLGDEEIYYNGWVPSNFDIFHSYGWYQNIVVCTNSPGINVPWAQFIYDPRYSNYVDIYEGGYGYTRGVWRSEAASCMGNSHIPYYNAISRYDITRRVMELSGVGFDAERDFFSVDTDDWGRTDY